MAHFAGVLAYAFPYKNDVKPSKYVYAYIYPYFHQSWSMFVPIPKQNFQIYVKHDGENWKDIFTEVVIAHRSNRFAAKENLMLALSSAVRYYSSSVKSENTIEQNDKKNINYLVLEKIISGYLNSKNGQAPKNLEVIIRIKELYGNQDYSHYHSVKLLNE